MIRKISLHPKILQKGFVLTFGKIIKQSKPNHPYRLPCANSNSENLIKASNGKLIGGKFS